MTGKMALEKRFVDRHRFYSDAFRSCFIEADNAIDHQERIPVRQNLDDFVAVESTSAFWYNARNSQRFAARLFLRNCSGQLSVRGVTRLHRDQMAANSATDQREIAYNIQDFVTDEFIRKPERLDRKSVV